MFDHPSYRYGPPDSTYFLRSHVGRNHPSVAGYMAKGQVSDVSRSLRSLLLEVNEKTRKYCRHGKGKVTESLSKDVVQTRRIAYLTNVLDEIQRKITPMTDSLDEATEILDDSHQDSYRPLRHRMNAQCGKVGTP